MPGYAIDIAVGAQGSVWIIGVDSVAYSWNGSAWIKDTQTGGVNITVAADGHPWLVGANGAIFRKN